MYPEARYSRGMGLISALFLVLVVTVLIVAIARTVMTSADAFAQDTLSLRAFLAAESGAEIGLNRVFAPAGVPACADRVVAFDLEGLRGCQADVVCRSVLVEGTPHYTVESAGRCTAGQMAAERTVVVRAQP